MKKILHTIFCLSFCTMLGATEEHNWEKLIQDAIKSAENKKYQDSQELLKKALELMPELKIAHYNLGIVFYKEEKFKDALEEFQFSLGDEDAKLAGDTYYNIGNCHYKLGNLDLAMDSYRKSLKMNPGDRDCRANLEFVAELLSRQKISEKAKQAFAETNRLVEKHLYQQALKVLSQTTQDEPAAAKEYQSYLQRLQQIVQLAPQGKGASI